MEAYFSYFFCGLALAASLLCVFNRNPVGSAFSLVVVLFSFAGLYALMQAHFIAAIQIILYAGAVMVLFVFVIMLLNADAPSLDIERSSIWLKGIVLLSITGLIGCSSWVFYSSYFPEVSPTQIENTKELARALFADYVVPLEVTSILILAGITCTIAIAKRRKVPGEGTA
jgi:NADH-quinone oxidoreductase subunit J